MNLQQVIEQSEKGSFNYKGEKQQVMWREYVDEVVGYGDDGRELKVRHFAIFFLPANITLRSMHPWPKIVQMSNYSM